MEDHGRMTKGRETLSESKNKKVKRLEKDAEKKKKIREKTLQKRLLENWLILPEK